MDDEFKYAMDCWIKSFNQRICVMEEQTDRLIALNKRITKMVETNQIIIEKQCARIVVLEDEVRQK